jgi:xylono-1,5-lactonase
LASLISDAHAAIGESPLWLDGDLLWTDPIGPKLHSYRPGQPDTAVSVEQSIWSLARAGNRIVGTLDDRFCAVALDGAISGGPPAPIAAGCRFNDMAVDSAGGLWAGAMHKGVLATKGAIFHAASLDETPMEVATGLGVPNGMAFSADGGTLYVIDTLERTLLAYPVRDHTLAEPVIVSDFLGLPGKPDGMTIAADGSLWVAMWGGGCVVRIARDGASLQSYDVPAPHVSSVCIVDETRLFVTTSRMRLSPEALAQHPGSGGLFEISLGDPA